jgi:hypothetical protein
MVVAGSGWKSRNEGGEGNESGDGSDWGHVVTIAGSGWKSRNGESSDGWGRMVTGGGGRGKVSGGEWEMCGSSGNLFREYCDQSCSIMHHAQTFKATRYVDLHRAFLICSDGDPCRTTAFKEQQRRREHLDSLYNCDSGGQRGSHNGNWGRRGGM